MATFRVFVYGFRFMRFCKQHPKASFCPLQAGLVVVVAVALADVGLHLGDAPLAPFGDGMSIFAGAAVAVGLDVRKLGGV
jgi:hypothetical protein